MMPRIFRLFSAALPLILLALAGLVPVPAAAQPAPAPWPPQEPVFPPPDSQALNIVLLETFTLRAGLLPLEPVNPRDPSPQPPLQAMRRTLHDGLIISSEERYRELVGKDSGGVDWNLNRVIVFEETIVYKLREEESSSIMAGMYQTASAIVIGRRFFQHGPVQGTAQLPEWFGHETRLRLYLIPAQPAAVLVVNLGLNRHPVDVP